MRALIQRVLEAEVTVAGESISKIGPGLLIFLGVSRSDGTADTAWLARKCAGLRIFPDGADRMNLSLLQSGGEALVVSQFTLCGDASKGNRPTFVMAADSVLAEPLYEGFVADLRSLLGADRVRTGIFRAMMNVSLVNDGPVTILVDSPGAAGPPAEPQR